MTDWVEVCRYEAIYPDTGVCALIQGRQVAIFRLSDGTLHAVSNYDPFSGANVMSRGIVGDRNGEPKVASPIYKQTLQPADGRLLRGRRRPARRVPGAASPRRRGGVLRSGQRRRARTR